MAGMYYKYTLRYHKKRYFILTNSKLFHFDSDKKEKVKGVINFKVAKCNILEHNDGSFRIYIKGFEKFFLLKPLKN